MFVLIQGSSDKGICHQAHSSYPRLSHGLPRLRVRGVKGTREPMTVLHGKKDKNAVPKVNRKIHKTKSSKEPRGGKVLAVEEETAQMDLFAITAEVKSETMKAKGHCEQSKSSQGPKVPKVANMFIKHGFTDMEHVCTKLTLALEKVASNKGAPGPNRQTIAEVKEAWESIYPKLIQLLLEGKYKPGEIRRVWIPKAGGGERGLGIPDVIDRVVQEAVRQVLEPRYEPTFHENSHGFRPNRGCHTAIKKASEYLKEGFSYVVDIDLKDFFNRVNHQRLLATLQRETKDPRMLKLIERMLVAKVVMPDGVKVESEQGVPQGGPLSPLLSNIVLHELDEELSARGHRFVRYADDCNIYVKSERAGIRVMTSVSQFIEKRLRLEVNKDKSAVAKPHERHFLGFSLNRNDLGEVEVNLSQRSKLRLRERVKDLTPRNWGETMSVAIHKVNVYLKGWMGFFGICTEVVEWSLKTTDAHIRRRLRAMKLKQWKRRRTMLRRLVQMGANKQSAGRQLYDDRKGIWKLSHTHVVNRTLKNAYWREEGLCSTFELWKLNVLKRAGTVSEQTELCLG